MKTEELRTLFEKHNDKFLEDGDLIPGTIKRRDIRAFILLDKLVPGTRDMVRAAEHDEIWLGVSEEELAAVATEENVIELIRCGIRLDDNGLCMFV